MIVEAWTHRFEEQWSLARVYTALDLDILNKVLHECIKAQRTTWVVRQGEPWKILSIFVHFDLGMIFRLDELDKTAVALIHKKHDGRLTDSRISKIRKGGI